MTEPQRVGEPLAASAPVSASAPNPRARLAFSLLLVAGVYFLAGKAGLSLAVGNASVSAVWPPAGIAIAALILGGSELWPAVFAGAFLVNLTTTWDIASTLGIASGNTMEALVGAFLANRYALGKHALERPSTVLTFALLSGFVASTIAATVGTTSLTLAHLAPSANFLQVWGPYWVGDSIGTIEVGSLILAISAQGSGPRPLTAFPGRTEILGLGGVTVAAALLVFTWGAGTFGGGYPLIFIVLPPVIWASFRLGPVGATASTSTVSLIAVVATVGGLGPFATLPVADSLLALRVFIGSLALTALLVAAEVSQHHRMETELNHVRKELQRMLQERTVQLDSANSLAKVGHWTFDVGSKKTIWSDEMYGIFGYGDERFPIVLDRALEHVHPDDRDRFLRQLKAAIHSTDPANLVPSETRYRLVLPGGERRTVLARLQVSGVENGRAARITGTVQDITERQANEDELRRLRDRVGSPPAKNEGFLLWAIPWIDRRER
jgi:PAS domain S-box-containing protein